MNPHPRPTAPLWTRWALALGAALLALTATAQPLGRMPDPVRFTGQWSADRVVPGGQAVLAIRLDVDEKWHINPDPAQTRPVGDFNPLPTRVSVQAPEGVQVGPVQFPEPHAVQVGYADGELLAFESGAVLYVPVIVPYDAAPGEVAVSVEIIYQACNDQVCLAPRSVTVAPPLTVVAEADAAAGGPGTDAALFDGFDRGVFAQMLGGTAAADAPQPVRFDLFAWTFDIGVSTWLGLGALLAVAAVGGGLLNLTPCVLPVIPIKIMGLSQSAGNRGRCLLLGTMMSAGVVGFWLALGGVIAAVAGFTATNQLFQYPAFTIGVGVVIAVMAVGMCGVFTLRLPRAVYQISPSHDSVAGSVGFGVMTAVLSTPCTAPFMGAAAAWAATQHPATTLVTFAAIGGGMALPYFILSAFPRLIAWVPRTGPASELIKQVMGLLMLAAAAYFIGVGLSGLVVTPPEPPSQAYWWAVAALVGAAGLWLAVRTVHITDSPLRRVVFCGLGAAAVLAAGVGGVRLTDPGPIAWTYYTPERFERALADGDAVVLEFTAEWCLNCKALEQTVLHDPRVAEALGGAGVVPMKVDLTGNNPVGNAMLSRVGRVAIPLLVVFDPAGNEVFKSDFYRVQQVVDAVNEARGGSLAAGR